MPDFLNFQSATLFTMAAAAAAFWRQLWALLCQIKALFVVQYDVTSPDIQTALRCWVVKECRIITATTTVQAVLGWRHSSNQFEWVPVVDVPESSFFFLAPDGRVLLFSARQNSGKTLTPNGSGGVSLSTLRFLGGSAVIESCLKKAIEFMHNTMYSAESKANCRHCVNVITMSRTVVGYSPRENEAGQVERAPSTLPGIGNGLHYKKMLYDSPDAVCDTPQKRAPFIVTASISDFLEDARRWHASKDWYQAKGIPWRRGYLLYGKPGNGKTTSAVAVARELDLPVWSLDLSGFDNPNLVMTFNKVRSNSPAMVLLEDFDRVFHGDKNIHATNEHTGVTFDCLLNQLGGAKSLDGVMVVITANDISRIDPAIFQFDGERASRPGRIDRGFEILSPDYEQRRAMFAAILDASVPAAELCRLAAETEGLQCAQVEEKAVQLALDAYWTPGNALNR